MCLYLGKGKEGKEDETDQGADLPGASLFSQLPLTSTRTKARRRKVAFRTSKSSRIA